MESKMKSRKKRLFLFFVRAACFCLLAVFLLAYTQYVLTPKYDYGICSMNNLYAQPENSVDVLVVGSSLVYSGVNTNELWNRYGIAAYDLCSAEQPFWVSYYVIREALKTQRPRLIVLDAKPATYLANYSKPGRVVLSTYGIRSLENRLGAIFACVEDRREAGMYALGLSPVHGNYENVTASDFVIPPDNGGRGTDWKGFIEMNETVSFSPASFAWTEKEKPINQREEEYVRKIFELAREEGIGVLLLSVPYIEYPADHAYYNTLWRIAAEYGVEGINFNHASLRSLMNNAYDFADTQHLNIRGSEVFSRRLGYELKKRFDLPDRRSDPYYASYDACLAAWEQRKAAAK